MNRIEISNSFDTIPQFNVACVGQYVCLSCNSKLIASVSETLGAIEEISKDFANFIDESLQTLSGQASAIFDEDSEYCIIKFDNVIQINMKQEFANDLSYAVIDCLRSMSREPQFANALYSFAKRMQAAAEGNIQRPNAVTRHPMPSGPILMYQSYPPMAYGSPIRPNFRYQNRNNNNTRRNYGSYEKQ